MTVNYYVGWVGESWRTELLPEPTAPGNYKDLAKISAYVEEKRVKQQHTARRLPIYGRLESVFVYDDSGVPVFSRTADDIAGGADGRTAGLAFLDWLCSTFIFPDVRDQFIVDEDPTCTGLRTAARPGAALSDLGPVQLVGFDIKTALKMAAMEGFTAARTQPLDIPCRMWHLHQSDAFCVDPFEMIRKGVPDLTLAAAMRFFDIEVDQERDSPDAGEWAAIARRLAIAIGLAGEGARGISNEDAVRAAYPVAQ